MLHANTTLFTTNYKQKMSVRSYRNCPNYCIIHHVHFYRTSPKHGFLNKLVFTWNVSSVCVEWHLEHLVCVCINTRTLIYTSWSVANYLELAVIHVQMNNRGTWIILFCGHTTHFVCGVNVWCSGTIFINKFECWSHSNVCEHLFNCKV